MDSIHPVVKNLGPSPTLAINERSNALRAEGRTIYKFGLGQSPFPVPEPVVEALRNNAPQKDYLPVQGLVPLREAVAAYHNRHEGTDLGEDQVVVGPGSKELMFLLQLAFDGETVLPTPRWVSYLPQAAITGRPVANLPTRFEDRWRLSAAQLDAHCRSSKRPRLLILNYPGNPEGLTYGEETLRSIATVARRHGVLVLSDEIYGPLHHEGGHVSISRFYPEGTLISGGLSKWCGAGGWRLGTLTFPREHRRLREAVQVVASETFTSVSAPIQYAAVRGFEEGDEIETYLGRSRAVLRALGNHIHETLVAANVRVHPPEGAFYLMLDFSQHTQALRKRGITSGAELCENLLQDTGVALLHGECFGRDPGELSARMSYVNFDGGAALRAAADVEGGGDLLEKLRKACPEPFEGLGKLVEWLG